MRVTRGKDPHRDSPSGGAVVRREAEASSCSRSSRCRATRRTGRRWVLRRQSSRNGPSFPRSWPWIVSSASPPQKLLDGIVDPVLVTDLGEREVRYVLESLFQFPVELAGAVGALDLAVAEEVAL